MKNYVSLTIVLGFCLGGCLAQDYKTSGMTAYHPHKMTTDSPVPLQEKPLVASGEEGNDELKPLSPYDITVLGASGPEGRNGKALNDYKVPSHCRIKDRFDRKETLAYQWGRNRLGVKVHSSGANVRGAYFRYRLKFQNYKTSKEKCRYPAAWQGLIGSSYNEFFLRETNTVWEDLDGIEDDVRSRFGTLLQN